MNDKNRRTHWSFWAISILTFIWNLLGAINFLVKMNPGMRAAYRESERAIIEGRPLWATVGFAIGVFGGAIGCILLLLRKASAIYLFIASFLGVILTMIHALGAGIEFGLGEGLGIILMPLVMAVFLIWYSRHAKTKGLIW